MCGPLWARGFVVQQITPRVDDALTRGSFLAVSDWLSDKCSCTLESKIGYRSFLEGTIPRNASRQRSLVRLPLLPHKSLRACRGRTIQIDAVRFYQSIGRASRGRGPLTAGQDVCVGRCDESTPDSKRTSQATPSLVIRLFSEADHFHDRERI